MTTYDPAKDPYVSFANTPENYGVNSTTVSPSDTVDFTSYPKGIVVTVTGNIRALPLKGVDGTYINFTDAPVGFVLPFRCRRIQSSGTSATLATIED